MVEYTIRHLHSQTPIPQVGHHEHVAGTEHGLHTRRKSVLPGEPLFPEMKDCGAALTYARSRPERPP